MSNQRPMFSTDSSQHNSRWASTRPGPSPNHKPNNAIMVNPSGYYDNPPGYNECIQMEQNYSTAPRDRPSHNNGNSNIHQAPKNVNNKRVSRLTSVFGSRNAPLRNQTPKRSEIGVFTKYFLFVYNFLLFVIGIGMTALGAYILVLKKKVVSEVLDFFMDPACDMALVGSIVTVVSFLGFVGALRENTCCLKAYKYMVFFLLLCQLTVFTLMFLVSYVPSVRDSIMPTGTFKDAIKKYRDDVDLQNIIDSLQTGLHCCGITDTDTGFLDWNENPYFKCSEPGNSNSAFAASPERCSVPPSCCRPQSLSQGRTINNRQCGRKVFQVDTSGKVIPNNIGYVNNIYTDGCLKSFQTWREDHPFIISGVILGLLIPQIFVMVLNSNLIKMIRFQKYRWLS